MRHRRTCGAFVTLRRLRDAPSRRVSSSAADTTHTPPRFNALGVPMISAELHARIFGQSPAAAAQPASAQQVHAAIEHLRAHRLWGQPVNTPVEPRIHLPPIHGSLDCHFRRIADQQTAAYRRLADWLVSGQLPPAPRRWTRQPGWRRYDTPDDEGRPVPAPDCDAFVFDVEVLVLRRTVVMATAASPHAWYGWVSPLLCDDSQQSTCIGNNGAIKHGQRLDMLVPLHATADASTCRSPQSPPPAEGGCGARLVVGHNVGYDRSWVREQYQLHASQTRFLDTMSMHVAVGGVTSGQRALLVKKRSEEQRQQARDETAERPRRASGALSLDWLSQTCLNSLADVYKLYCDQTLDKLPRDVFVSGDVSDVTASFDELMNYCAVDVLATWRVLRHLWPQFLHRFPHPVTLAGTLEMGTTFLPVSSGGWRRYVRACRETYADLENELSCALRALADEACRLTRRNAYQQDPWLWDLDWSTQPLRLKKLTKRSGGGGGCDDYCVRLPHDWTAAFVAPPAMTDEQFSSDSPLQHAGHSEHVLDEAFASLWASASRLYKKQSLLPGYPAWYRDLCDPATGRLSSLSASKRCVPKLLRLTWHGYPLHHDAKAGWGYLVPRRAIPNPHQGDAQAGHDDYDDDDQLDFDDDDGGAIFPLEQLQRFLATSAPTRGDQHQLDGAVDNITTSTGPTKTSKPRLNFRTDQPPEHMGASAVDSVRVRGCRFFRLPHGDGTGNNVGNPLARGFIGSVESGTLASAGDASAARVLRITQTLSYWRNTRDRVYSQRPVYLRPWQLPRAVREDEEYAAAGRRRFGVIVPQVRVAGTLTRRAVERTWLTASKVRQDRLGSELRAMIEAPPGYRFVGADVDSQELWIAALLGDSAFCRLHGCTAFGWMTLQGERVHGTDLHSRTAAVVGVTRDLAKVLNYGRIYGGARPFAVQLLRQHNPALPSEQLSRRVAAMYAATKGELRWRLNGRGRSLLAHVEEHIGGEEGRSSADGALLSTAEVRRLSRLAGACSWRDLVAGSAWHGGSESHMFNRLEQLASQLSPATPVLDARMTRGLEPASVGSAYGPSRVNWVVQSSAVDFLHAMLVCMRWLLVEARIDGRFCISIHDEVRYLVRRRQAVHAALALQITNLLTRSLFAERLGMTDLPRAVAFFSTVEVDRVLRKDVGSDCRTPSNPEGLLDGYGVRPGEALDIDEIVRRTGGSIYEEAASKCDDQQ